MTESDIGAAEKRGYSKGYAAGRRRKQRDISAERRYREQQAFLDRAYLSVLAAAMDAQGWKFGDEPINSTRDRVKLAVPWAVEALRQRPLP